MTALWQFIENFIEPSFELVDTWNGYWNAVMPIGHQSTMAHPFPRLKIRRPLAQNRELRLRCKNRHNISTMTKLCEIYAGVRLDDALFVYLMDPVAWEYLCDVLTQTYLAIAAGGRSGICQYSCIRR